MKILLLDNFDSFTYNLYHYLLNAGVKVTVIQNNVEDEDILNLKFFDALVLSPGPCTPHESGNLMQIIKNNVGTKPILGVCLGMQGLGIHFGWELKKAKLPVHGKSSMIKHSETGIFQGIPNPMQVGRSDFQSLWMPAFEIRRSSGRRMRPQSAGRTGVATRAARASRRWTRSRRQTWARSRSPGPSAPATGTRRARSELPFKLRIPSVTP